MMVRRIDHKNKSSSSVIKRFGEKRGKLQGLFLNDRCYGEQFGSTLHCRDDFRVSQYL